MKGITIADSMLPKNSVQFDNLGKEIVMESPKNWC